MKKTILLATLALVGITACTDKQEAPAPTEAQQLIERMSALRDKGIMYAHQDDPFYGITWAYEEGRSDTKDLLGDYPAVMGFDLGGIEMGDLKNLDSVPFTTIREEIVKHHQRGGIITVSWHPRNPMTDTPEPQAFPAGSAWDLTDTTVVRNILPGGEKHEMFDLWLERLTDYMLTLKTPEGEMVPIIFRPLHEYDGSWFWWGDKFTTPEQFVGLWNMIQDKVRAKLPTNIVYAFSPNLNGFWTDEKFLAKYPGDDRVDLLGIDAYQWGPEEQFVIGMQRDVAFIATFAAEHGKLFAITECGLKNLTNQVTQEPTPDWWSRVFMPSVKDSKPCYFLPWRNYNGTAHGDKLEYFGFTPDDASANDVKALYAEKAFLLVKDIQTRP